MDTGNNKKISKKKIHRNAMKHNVVKEKIKYKKNRSLILKLKKLIKKIKTLNKKETITNELKNLHSLIGYMVTKNVIKKNKGSRLLSRAYSNSNL